MHNTTIHLGYQFQASCMKRGYGANKDHGLALELYLKGAEHKSRFAMFRISNMYHKGKGVAGDIDEAIKWYRRAANLGHKKARERLLKLKKN